MDAVKRERERERRYKENFDWRMEDIGVRGVKRVQLVMPDIDGSRIKGGVVCRS